MPHANHALLRLTCPQFTRPGTATNSPKDRMMMVAVEQRSQLSKAIAMVLQVRPVHMLGMHAGFGAVEGKLPPAAFCGRQTQFAAAHACLMPSFSWST